MNETVWYWPKNSHKVQQIKKGSPEIHPIKYKDLIQNNEEM